MDEVVLTRFAQTKFATFGELKIDDFLTLYTVERPWRNNKPFVSCLPAGIYQCHWRPTTTSVPRCFNKHTWYLEGRYVSYRHATKARYAVAFHIGNKATDVTGCIAPGMRLGYLGREWAVSSSNSALTAMHRRLGEKSFKLIIRPDKTDYYYYATPDST